MRWATSVVGIALLLAGCGNWSNDDVAFVEALPTERELLLTFPVQAAQADGLQAGAPDAAVCASALDRSRIWTIAIDAGKILNVIVDDTLEMILVARGVEPTVRTSNSRTWGPFVSRRNPARRLRVDMNRTVDGQGLPTYDYKLLVWTDGGEPQTVIHGIFRGHTARDGAGELSVTSIDSQDLEIGESGSGLETVVLSYDRTANPRVTTITLNQDYRASVFLPKFNYKYWDYDNGNGRFLFKYDSKLLGTTLVEHDISFASSGAGSATITAGLGSDYKQCWDATGCVLRVDDPKGVSSVCSDLLGTCPKGECVAF